MTTVNYNDLAKLAREGELEKIFTEWYETMPDGAKSEELRTFMLLSFKKGATEVMKKIT